MDLQKRKKYSKEYIEDVVNMVKTGDKSVPRVAKDLGIHEGIIYRWFKKYSDQKDTVTVEIHEKDAELRKLRKKLADVSEERDILKKAINIFSRQEN